MDNELIKLKEEVDLVLYENQQVVVSNQEEYAKAGDILKTLKNRKKYLEDKRHEHTDPLEDLKKQWIAEFRLLTDPLDKMIEDITGTMKTFYIEEQKRLNEEQARIDAEALKKAEEENLGDVDVPVVNDIKTQTGAVSKTTAIKFMNFKVVDESLVPREYLIVDESKIREAVKKGIKSITGVEIFEDVRLGSRNY